MKTLLVPCDFSKTALEAFKFAIAMAKVIKGKIVVLHVIDLPMTYDSAFDGQSILVDPALYKAIADDARKRFGKLKLKHAKGFTNVSFVTEQGPVTPMIRQYMDIHKPDVVIMGTNGASGIKEFFVGSNTEKIVRFSKVPVFAIRKSREVSTVKNIVFPTTLQLNQRDFVKRLQELQRLFGAKLHILYVNTPSNFVGDGELNDYVKHYQLTNYTLNMRSNRHEQDGIIAFVNERKADMIAMATHARKGLSHFVSGSIAEDVVNHINCPVWTYALKKS